MNWVGRAIRHVVEWLMSLSRRQRVEHPLPCLREAPPQQSDQHSRQKAAAERQHDPSHPVEQAEETEEKGRPEAEGSETARQQSDEQSRQNAATEPQYEPSHPAEQAQETEEKGRPGGEESETAPKQSNEQPRQNAAAEPQREPSHAAEQAHETERKETFGGEELDATPGDEPSQWAGERKRLKPGERGGRRTVSPPGSKRQGVQVRPRRTKPEVVCWKQEWEWVMGVELPNDLLARPSLEVSQSGSPLTRDPYRECCWRVAHPAGQVEVRWEQGTAKQRQIELGREGLLVYKLNGRSHEQGRRVKSPSRGSYLVVAPDRWRRDEALSGAPPRSPEPVSIEGYRAHFFDLEKEDGQAVGFLDPQGEPFRIERRELPCQLVGARLEDAGVGGVGPIFGVGPPQIRAADEGVWERVEAIVCGEVSAGPKPWRMEFSPVPGLLEQKLPNELASRKSGWYFLRFYDGKDDLIDSQDFRFASELSDVRIYQPSPLPSGAGHGTVHAEFLHGRGCSVHPLDGDARLVNTAHEDSRTLVAVPPRPEFDLTRWLVKPLDGSEVQLSILIERVWWALGDEGSEPQGWQDKQLSMDRGELRATSEKGIWVRLPGRRWINELRVGFKQCKARRYPVKVSQQTVFIPLRDFEGAREVEDGTGAALKVWIERNGKQWETPVLSVARPEPVLTPAGCSIGLGRKRSVIARAVIRKGSEEIVVNGQPMWDYFKQAPPDARRHLRRLLRLAPVNDALRNTEVDIAVVGSSPERPRQGRAATYALARALMANNSELRSLLRQGRFAGANVTRIPDCLREVSQ